MSDPTVLVTVVMSSVFLIVLIGVVLFVFVQKSPGLALCLIGVFMSIAAAVQASVSGVAVHANGAQMMAVGTGSGPLLKIAVILVLGGIALVFVSRPRSVSTPSDQKVTNHVA